MEEKLYRNAEWMREKYHTEHLHVDDMAKQANCAPGTIITWLSKLGVPLRESGSVPIYPSAEQMEKMAREGQKLVYMGDIIDWWKYPDLPFLYDNVPKLSRFLNRAKGWKKFWEKLSYVSQYGDKVVAAQYYRMQTQRDYGRIPPWCPQIKVYGPRVKINYKAYLCSEEWTQKSSAVRERVGKCQVCSSKTSLHAHHNTYENLGQEKEYDLTVLCEECHKLFHTRQRLINRYFKNSWTRITKEDFYAGNYGEH